MRRRSRREAAETRNADLVVGQWVMRCEARTLDDIRAMGGNSPEDERRFETAKRVSEINLAAYRNVRPALDQVDGDAADGGADAQLASAARCNTKPSAARTRS